MIVAEEILSAEEVAKLLRLSPQTVKRMANQRELPGFRLGGRWRFRRDAIERYIDELERQERKPEDQ